MFNIGPMELLVLAIVGLIVLGPEKLPTMARDVARMIKTLREMANGARAQLREELGPDLAYLADTDPRTLNPRHVIRKAVMGDAETGGLNPANLFKETFAEVKDDIGTTSLAAELKKDIAAPAQLPARPAEPEDVVLEPVADAGSAAPEISLDKPATPSAPVSYDDAT